MIFSVIVGVCAGAAAFWYLYRYKMCKKCGDELKGPCGDENCPQNKQ